MNNDFALRPQSLKDYIGQPDLVARLRILVAAAKSRNEPMPHTLLHGGPGLGKTTLAHIIANEVGAKVHVIMGPALEKPTDVESALGRLNAGDILFIDEIHSACRKSCEIFYSAMEDRKMVIMLDCGTLVRPVTINLPPFTLVAATTQPGILEGPLRDRFGIPLAMEFYSDADLTTIITANAIKLGMVAEPGALKLLASRSRGTPRIANHLLRFVRDYSVTHGAITVALVESALRMQGIDSLGLNEQDRIYLGILTKTYSGGPVGANALAATMGLKVDTVEGVIEPYLLIRELIFRSQRGRRATEKGTAHLAAKPVESFM